MVQFKAISDNSTTIKSPREIEAMREAGRRLTRIMKDLVAFAKPGVTAKELDVLAAKKCKELDVVSGAYNYGGGPNRFPGHICVSINEVVVHGIPGRQRFQDGDIVSLDVAVSHKGYFADMCVTIPIGEISAERKQLLAVCREALFAGIAEAKAGNRLSNVGAAIEDLAEAHGMHVVREFVGHGIGRRMHEPPQVPHYGPPGKGPMLRPGMVIAIEPQITLGSPVTRFMPDGWTAVTVDGSLSAHFEHTVAISNNGPDVLTNWGIE
jgi:methionyl aminopeptidase